MYLVDLNAALPFLPADGLATVGAARGHGSHMGRQVQVQRFGAFAGPGTRRHGGLDGYVLKVNVLVVLVVRIPLHGLHRGFRYGDILKLNIVVIGSLAGYRNLGSSVDGFGSLVPR
jgi:hypothetical protein